MESYVVQFFLLPLYLTLAITRRTLLMFRATVAGIRIFLNIPQVLATIIGIVIHRDELVAHPLPYPDDPSLLLKSRYEYGDLKHADGIRILLLDAGDYDDPIAFDLIEISLSWWWYPYEALSYVWGDSTPRNLVYANGRTLQITDSLYSALRHLRMPHRARQLWVDAVCINQTNKAEKTSQIGQMGKIYKRAANVLIWLGEDDDESSASRAFQDVRDIRRLFPNWITLWWYFKIGADIHKPIRSSLIRDSVVDRVLGRKSLLDYDMGPLVKLFNRPWFQRRWVIQEYVLSKHALALCGEQEIDFWEIVEIAHLFALPGARHLSRLFMTEEGRNASQGMDRCQAMLRMKSARKPSLLSLVLSTRTFLVSDARDSIFSILGLADDVDKDELMKMLNYELQPKDFFELVVAWGVVRHKNLGYLALCCGDSVEPTWVPDFANLRDCYPVVGDDLRPFAAGGSPDRVRASCSMGILRLSGWDVDTVGGVEIVGWDAEFAPSTLPEVERAQQETLKLYRWINDCKVAAMQALDITYMSDDIFDQFWRTMICDLTASGEKAPPSYKSLFEKYRFACSPDRNQLSSDADLDQHKELLEATMAIQPAITNNYAKRKFAVTEEGRFGMVPRVARAKDRICIFAGACVPFILRPRSKGGWLLLGDCYLHGVMNGEALQDRSEPSDFEIY